MTPSSPGATPGGGFRRPPQARKLLKFLPLPPTSFPPLVHSSHPLFTQQRYETVPVSLVLSSRTYTFSARSSFTARRRVLKSARHSAVSPALSFTGRQSTLFPRAFSPPRVPGTCRCTPRPPARRT